MTKKNLSSLFIGFLVLFALRFVNADWQLPPADPVTAFDPPVNAEAVAQVKTGGLSVGTFWAAGNASFSQQTFFRGSISGQVADPDDQTGISGVDAPLRIGGVDQAGTHAYYVDTTATGTVKANTLSADELATGGEKRKLCADDEGHVVFCPPPALLSAGVTSAPVQGGTNDTNAICDVSITAPAPTGGVAVSIQYTTNASGQSATCQLTIPEGELFANDYPGTEYQQLGGQSLQITNYCFDSQSTTPYLYNDPGTTGIQNC